jgi:D-arabinose 1-dehydrogenase-like Zn-dependent alcohol dehydrogenase
VVRSRSAKILGYTNNELSTPQRGEALSAVLQHAANGLLTVDHEVTPLEDIADAWDRQAQGVAQRRIVVDLTSAG